jgi:hypothetical protein
VLPCGRCSARSHAEVMAQPTLAGTRLVAVTLAGQAGAAAPTDFSPEGFSLSRLLDDNQEKLVLTFHPGGLAARAPFATGPATS